MQYLLDTHTLIWFINGDNSLPDKVKEAIQNLENKCFISIASLWEISIKSSLGKLQLKAEFSQIAEFLLENEIEVLSITFEHLQKLLSLKYYHRDPFDRLIIAQAISEKLTILSKDTNFKKYRVKLLWE